MERARQLREERKNGVSGGGHNTSGSVFKSAGADFVHRNASNGRQSNGISQMSLAHQDSSTAHSMLSSPNIRGDGQYQSMYNRAGYQERVGMGEMMGGNSTPMER